MSERYEMTTASGCPITLESPGEDIGEDILTGHALVIGDRYSSAMVVEGTPAELLDFAKCLVLLVESIEIR